MLEPHARRSLGKRVGELDSTERFRPAVLLFAELAAIQPVQRHEHAHGGGRDVESAYESANPTKEDRGRLGTAGDDVLCGLGGSDRIEGGGGADVIIGGPERDTLFGGSGDDSFYARDGARDLVVGGRGRDRARADWKRDKVIGVERRF